MNELQVGQLAESLHIGYMAYAGTAVLLRRPEAEALIAIAESTNVGPAPVPTEQIFRNDGSCHVFSLSHAVRNVSASTEFQEVYDRLWLAGALITLGDELRRAGNFDRGPDLELVRHLRNGIAHGNRFKLDDREPSRLARFKGPDQRLMPDGSITPVGQAVVFEITKAVHGQPVLFDFMGPGDVCDLLTFISWRLIRLGNGDPIYDLWPQ